MQQAEECTKGKLDLVERSSEINIYFRQNILDKELEAKNNPDLTALDTKTDELNKSKLESNCEKG